MTAQVTSAKGVTGFLIWTGEAYQFRVYDQVGSFKDYSMLHCDLEVTIVDADATLYEYPNGTLSLDHNPETLGLNETSQA
jgi:hypothetical protein